MASEPEALQRDYYTRTASQYDAMHTACDDDEHYAALAFIDLVCDRFHLKTLLDVGAGTGRGVRFLSQRGRDVRGVEPVSALIDVAEKNGCRKGQIVEGSGYQLPFEDRAFDAVFECGVLHHVAQPERVVEEMMRVASRAVFLSDCNRFGQGRPLVRFIKLLLSKTRLWNTARFIQTRGKMYIISEGDGLAYSYSVFDSHEQLSKWADLVWPIQTVPDAHPAIRTWLHPLMTAPHVLLCAIKSDAGVEKHHEEKQR